MSNIWGKNIRLSIFGESHGPALGITISGLPPGFAIDFERVGLEMARRAPGYSEFSTPRKEKDEWEILSGVFEGKTTGTPLCVIIRNEDAKSSDYSPGVLRPGHADFAALCKYGGFADQRGGGHFSGRLTAPLVFAGAAAKQILEKEGVFIGARIAKIYNISDAPMPAGEIINVSRKPFPVYDDAAGEKMRQAILNAKEENNSLGGIIECAAIGLPVGWGEPIFDGMENRIATLVFGIPGVKGLEFGSGFAGSQSRGSINNDGFRLLDGQVRTVTNNSGGLLGGMTSGMPLIFRVAFKPTPSISKTQKTVDLKQMKNVEIQISGRHDPCIAIRAVPCVEAAAAIALYDASLDSWQIK